MKRKSKRSLRARMGTPTRTLDRNNYTEELREVYGQMIMVKVYPQVEPPPMPTVRCTQGHDIFDELLDEEFFYELDRGGVSSKRGY